MNKIAYVLLFVSLFFAACGPQRKLAKQHRYMEKSYLTIKKAVNEAEVSILNDTIKVLFPEHLLFKFNSSTINPENFPLMERFAGALNKYDKTSILINGYTDITGGEELNKALSQKRADSVKAVLQVYQVKDVRMYTWGMGSMNPIADNGTPQGRSRNRRVEFIVLYTYQPKQQPAGH